MRKYAKNDARDNIFGFFSFGLFLFSYHRYY